MKASNKTIRALVYEPGMPGALREVPHDLAALQAVVGGYIEWIRIDGALGIVCNDEGKLRGDLPNRYIAALDDTIAGTFLVCGTEGSEFASLTDADVRRVRQLIPEARAV